MGAHQVFLSYSHEDEVWKDRLQAQLSVLEREGRLEVWEDRGIDPGDEWRKEILAALDRASVAVLLISTSFLNSDFIRTVEVPRLLERRRQGGVRVIPVIARPCLWREVDGLKEITALPTDGKPLSTFEGTEWEQVVTEIAGEILRLLQEVPDTPGEKLRFDTTALPTTSDLLLGREEELARLDEVWGDEDVNVFSLVAYGGVGKSALVNVWLDGLRQRDWEGSDGVFGWSFYSQGARGDGGVGATTSCGRCCPGWAIPGRLRRRRGSWGGCWWIGCDGGRYLLVLDGLEPLQAPPGPEEGRLRDPVVSYLVKALAEENPGLCLITTRLPVWDLKRWRRSAASQLDLSHLSSEAGAALLGELGVEGSAQEMRSAAEEFGGHGLALTLLGTYLRDVCEGDVRRRGEVPVLDEDIEQGPHAVRVMASYAKWLGEGPELRILGLLGLLDRPARPGEIRVLRAAPEVSGLTEGIGVGAEVVWKKALAKLRRARLLPEAEGDEIDAHPLVRTYFGDRLKQRDEAAWREGNLRLYEYLRKKAPDLPETKEEMEPLYGAVVHGCRGGRVVEAFEEVYLRRIQRGNEFFSLHKLGAFGPDLSAVAGFFESLWDRPSGELPEASRAFLLSVAAFDLRALGRLREAVLPMDESLKGAEKKEDWKNAAIQAGNLSELTLTLGDVSSSRSYGIRSVELADRSGDAFQPINQRAKKADADHQAGDLSSSESLFAEAESRQASMQPEYPRLYSLPGYRYCDLLLGRLPSGYAAGEESGRERCEEVLERAQQTLKWVTPQNWVLDIALDHLTLGRAHQGLSFFASTAEEREDHRRRASEELDRAVEGLRQGGREDYLPRALLARASLYRQSEYLPQARRDVGEALEIAERGAMRLHECDAHLELCRICLAEGKADQARTHLSTATELVEDTGYHRRDPELEELHQALAV